jgi:hypothetical protein
VDEITREDIVDLIGSAVIQFRQTHDYYELVLDRALVSLFNPVLEPANVVGWGKDLAGTKVTDLQVHVGTEFVTTFDNGTRLVMSLKNEDYCCPEAAVFFYLPRPNKIVTIR